MMTRNHKKEYCPTCGHIVAKPRIGLTPTLFRNTVKNISSLEDLLNTKNKLIQIYRVVSQSDFNMTTGLFIQELDSRIGKFGIDELKDWLQKQISIIGNNQSENDLYRFLYDNYQDGINETFTVFYNKYCDSQEEGAICKSKNFVSRALDAIGLKARMSTIQIDTESGQRKKCAMILKASAGELSNIFSKIRIDS